MEPTISYITLGVADLERATAFYQTVLALPLLPASGPEVSFFDMGVVQLALYPRHQLAAAAGLDDPGPSRFAGFSLSHNVREARQVDALLQHVEEHGGTVVKPAAAAPWGGHVGFFTDPDGFLWEIAWHPRHGHH